jgi:hypothetical protein
MRTRSQFACRNLGTGAQDPPSGACYRAKVQTQRRGLKIRRFLYSVKFRFLLPDHAYACDTCLAFEVYRRIHRLSGAMLGGSRPAVEASVIEASLS